MVPCTDDKYYRFIFENSYDAILLSSPDGCIYRANAAACEMFQKTEEEICSAGRFGVVDMSDPRLKLYLAELDRYGRIRTELNFKRKDGSIFPTDFTSAVFEDENGRKWTVTIIRDITATKRVEDALRKAQEEVAHFATYDYLTGALNRRAFMNKFLEEISRARREKTVLSLLLLDVDNFKQINDELGHRGGDIVLQNFARNLTAEIRPYDGLGRYGGDEFIICLPNTTLEKACEIAERLRRHIENKDFIYKSWHVKVTASIGIGSYDYESDEDPEDLISKVDDRMYQAKGQRNCVSGL